MEININPLDWMTDKELEKKELHDKVVETFNAYREALTAASISAPDARIIRKVADELGLSEQGVRNILKKRGASLNTYKARKLAAV